MKQLAIRLLQTVLNRLQNQTENRLLEFGMLSQAFHFARVNRLQGDYLEFGVFMGKTFCYAHRLKQQHGFENMKLWGFDSFAGLPEVKPAKDEIWQTGDFSCSEEQFRRILHNAGMQQNEFELVKGFYSESLNAELHQKMAGRKAAIIYVDCDLYESTRDVLAFLPPYLQNGAVICFDDYFCYKGNPEQGEQKAVGEFLKANPQIRLLPYMPYGPVGMSFMCRVDSAGARVGP